LDKKENFVNPLHWMAALPFFSAASIPEEEMIYKDPTVVLYPVWQVIFVRWMLLHAEA
jgi:hypothetical protein